MDTIFPFGFPFATGFYLTFYVVTLMIHVAFMNYVLAGTGYLAARFVLRGGRDIAGAADSAPARSARTLADWMPLMLSGAITAGIAPLLFLQILYKRSYYTANLLLFHRWMSILPVLIVGFYALYVTKTAWAKRTPNRWLWAAVGLVPFLCVAFTGYSWTENHLLSVSDQAAWTRFYLGDRWFFFTPQLVPRLSLWAFGAIPTLALVLAWQRWGLGRRENEPAELQCAEARHLSTLALVGLALTALAGLSYAAVAGDLLQKALLGPMALPYVAIAVVGVVVQVGSWMAQRGSSGLDRRWLVTASVGLASTLLGMTVARESIRLTTLGAETVEALYPLHQTASQVGGLVVFLLFFAVNAGLIALCVVLVSRGRRTEVAATPG
jgi:hypothetical protein